MVMPAIMGPRARRRPEGHRTPLSGIVRPAITRLPGVAIVLLLLVSGLALDTTGMRQAVAQDTQRIAAVVNDAIISVRDVLNRTRLIIATSGLRDTESNRRRLTPQILQALIDERLQLDEASRLQVTIGDNEIDRAKRLLETNNRMPEGGFDRYLAANSIDRHTAREQIRASLAWTRLVRGRFANATSVTAEEIEETLADFERNLGKPQYLVSEILLSVGKGMTEDQVKALAKRLVADIRAGSDFNAIAREFSASVSASAGGGIGWVAPGQLAPELDTALRELEPRQVSEPLPTRTGYRILLLEDRQILTAGDPEQDLLTLKHVFLPLPQEPDDQTLATQTGIAERITATAGNCDDIERFSREIGSPVDANLGAFRLYELTPAIRTAVADLAVNAPSQPIRLPAGIAVIMICDRVAAASNIPTREAIEQQLQAQKIESLAQRYLRDLRRNAFIETRF